MADEEQKIEGQEGQPKEEGLKIDPRDEEIKQLKMNYHVMNQALETNNQLLQRLLANGAGGSGPAPQATKKRGVTDEELEEAFANGTGAKKLREYVEAMGENLVESHINPLRQTGLTAIGETVMEMLKPKMPYYDKYKAEIENFLNAYPPELKINAQAIKAAYNTVVGSHFDELAEEKVNQRIRQATAPAVIPKGAGRTQKREDEVPDPEDLSPGALSGIGRSEEDFAKRLGYKSWAEYQKLSEDTLQ